MRKIIFWLSGLLLSFSGVSQVTADIGLWGGGAGYLGDIKGKTLGQLSFPTAGGYFRYNFNPRVSARAMLLYAGNIQGEGTINGQLWSFGTPGIEKSILDFSVQAEINYYRYTLGNKKASFTSYLTAGLGVVHFPYFYRPEELRIINPALDEGDEGDDAQVTKLAIPFGMGFKFNAGKRLGLGLEYQMRKIFDDRLDDLDDPLVGYTDIWHNNDWAGFLGLHVTYKIYLGHRPCPAYEVK